MTDAELKLCAKHAYFEFNRLKIGLEHWREHKGSSQTVIQQMVHEATLVHMRCALGFLYAPAPDKNGKPVKRRAEDLTARHFLPTWDETQPKWFSAAYLKCNKLLVHLTLDRLKIRSGWQLEWIDDVLVDYQKFLDALPRGRRGWFKQK